MQALLRRFPRYDVVGPVHFQDNPFLRTMDSLRVQVSSSS